jgi:hypothetical protein
VCQLRRHTALRVTAEGAGEILGERISDQHRRTRTGMSVVGPHSWPPVRSVPRAHARGRESPNAGEPLGGGQSVGEVVTGWVGVSATVHHSPYTCSRTAPNGYARDTVSFNRFA